MQAGGDSACSCLDIAAAAAQPRSVAPRALPFPRGAAPITRSNSGSALVRAIPQTARTGSAESSGGGGSGAGSLRVSPRRGAARACRAGGAIFCSIFPRHDARRLGRTCLAGDMVCRLPMAG